MNNRQKKTLDLIFTDPISADVDWKDIESLISALGGEVTSGNGSRVRFSLNGRHAVFHRPHPAPVTNKLTARDVRQFLISAGVGPKEG